MMMDRNSTQPIAPEPPPPPLPTDTSPITTGQGWERWTPPIAIAIALGYLGIILFLPTLNVFVQAFSRGFWPFWNALQTAEFRAAAGLTLLVTAIVVPINAAFGLCAAVALARSRFPGRALAISLLDLPFSISPVVVGLMIVLLYGRRGWFGPLLEAGGLQVVFALPAMILATAFVTLPFVAREVLPILEEAGTDQEEAARTLGASEWQIFFRVTLPNIRWGLMYGTILSTARALGEFGAVSVVSGNIIRRTQTLPLFVEDAYKQYDTTAAYAAAVVLACLAAIALVLKIILERQLGQGGQSH